MKELIKKLNIYECEYKTNSLGIIFLKDCYLKEDIENILNQHNIITAPKSIKLSEIVSRLNYCTFDRYSDYISLSGHCIFLVIKNNKIIIDELPQTEKFKWLYALWLTGTEIIDDMEE